jgi:hypothetical protein
MYEPKFWHLDEETKAEAGEALAKLVDEVVEQALRSWIPDAMFHIKLGKVRCLNSEMRDVIEPEPVLLSELVIGDIVDFYVGGNGKVDPESEEEMAEMLAIKAELEKALAAVNAALP